MILLECATIGASNTNRQPIMPHIEPSDWQRLPRNGEKLAGFSRAAIYRLMREGLIKGKRICRPGSKKGFTFIDRNSITALINNAPDA